MPVRPEGVLQSPERGGPHAVQLEELGLACPGDLVKSRVPGRSQRAPEEQRYELLVGDACGGSSTTRLRDVVVLIHTEVDPAFEGRGLATKLIASAIEDIRARG